MGVVQRACAGMLVSDIADRPMHGLVFSVL